jgi:hypothetical protein
MYGDVAAPNLYAVAQQNCLQEPATRRTVMGQRSGSSSSNDDVERAGLKGVVQRLLLQAWTGEGALDGSLGLRGEHVQTAPCKRHPYGC